MKKSYGIICSCLLITLIVLLTACRGDWDYELPNNYAISRVNAHSVVLAKKHSTGTVYDLVIENYYVFAVSVIDNYILTSGVPTAEDFATDQELSQTKRIFYAVNYKTNEVLGPYHQEELETQMADILGINGINWIPTNTL